MSRVPSLSDYATIFRFRMLSVQEEPTKKRGDWKRTSGKRVKQRFSIHFTRLSPLCERDFFVLSSRNEMQAGKFPYASHRDRPFQRKHGFPRCSVPYSLDGWPNMMIGN